MANTTISALDEQFKEECKTLNLVYEYPGYTGTVRWAIITGLTKEELFEKYPEQIRPYVPFMILSLSQGEVIHAFNRNEDKFGKRQKNNGDAYGYEDGVTELFHTEAYAPDYWTMKDEEERRRKREELLDRLPELLATLNPRQQSRVRAYFYEERTARDIAAEEGVSHTAVLHSIQSALKKLKEMME